ncbi:MAG TPA: chondroitinase-B domain-containing protein [Rhodopila sp.]|nr:chondroitinase-B domain-containing protein [Rhodopila sp.]
MKEPMPVRPRPIHYLETAEPAASRFRRRFLRLGAGLGLAGAVVGIAAAATVLCLAQRTPRELAPYVLHRAEKHNPVIVGSAALAAAWLLHADRLAIVHLPALPPRIGASPGRSGTIPEGGRLRLVSNPDELGAAVAQANPGDVITLHPGVYRLEGWHPLKANRPGTPEAPITLRADRLGDVTIDSTLVEAIKVSAPYWHFENLVIRGVCGDHSSCEHALHIVGKASDTLIRNNRFEDFNAQIKINGENGAFPDHGVIEGNTLIDTAPRQTENPITPIDLVAASYWQISDNLIADFVRADSPRATYGAFAKGAGESTVFERNVVFCEWRLHGTPGEHVGLSLGGGGTAPGFRRDEGHTGFEQIGGIIRDNLIADCSDDGIYLNRAARSVVDRNTLIDTAGIDGRFVETSGTVIANLVDGVVRGRDGANLRGWDNDATPVLALFAGWHPERAYFRDPADLDLTWRSIPDPPHDVTQRVDLCGKPRTALAPPGAFVDYAACLERDDRRSESRDRTKS